MALSPAVAQSSTEEAMGWVALVVLFITVAVFAILISKERRRMHRQERRLCQNCGYDLRASTDDCPECGLPVRLAAPEPHADLDFLALARDWPAAAVAPPVPTGAEVYVPVYVTRSSDEADLVSQQLRARGVLTELNARRRSEVRGGMIATHTTVTVSVPAEDESAAQAILARFRRPPPAADGAGSPA